MKVLFARLFVALALVASATLLHAAPAGDTPSAAQHLQQALASNATRQALIDEGRKASFFCANCHGETGLSKFPEVPNLAGQNPSYVLVQMDAFYTGKRKDPFMQGLIKVLSERERAAIALFYSSSPVTPALPAPGKQAARGAELYAKICARCHLPDARGAETFPRLAGQQQEYLRINIRRYLNQTGERLYTPMTAAVTQLGEANIEAVTEYLSSLK